MALHRQNGRSEWIRTTGPHVPNVVLYQAELHSGVRMPRALYTYGERACNTGRPAGAGEVPEPHDKNLRVSP